MIKPKVASFPDSDETSFEEKAEKAKTKPAPKLIQTTGQYTQEQIAFLFDESIRRSKLAGKTVRTAAVLRDILSEYMETRT